MSNKSTTTPVDQIDTSIYEVREYYMDQTAFDEGEESGKPRNNDSAHGKWETEFGEIGSMYFDIVNIYWKIPGEKEIRMAPTTGGDVEPNNFDKAHQNQAVVFHWVARWDSMEHCQQGWAKAMQSEKFKALIGTHPLLKHFTRMESRFMKSILPPQRFMKKDKVYETRRYTFNEAKTPWNAETRQQYSDFIREVFSGDALPLKASEFWVAQATPVTTTVSGSQLLGGDAYAVEGVTAPHISWTAEWDSVQQAREFYAKALAGGKEAMQVFSKSPSGLVNPFYPNPDEILGGYKRVEQSFMSPVPCHNVME